jgi:glycosyltransferase involved in cell wall biosynthesis
MEKIRVALVHDWLTGQRGGEKVLEVLAEIFPAAPIYALFHFPGSQVDGLEAREIRTSFIQRLPFLKKKYRLYLPLFPLAAELFDLADYDLIVSSSHCVAKGIIPGPDSLHLSYVHSPVRYAWNQYSAYFSPRDLSFFSRLAVPGVIHRLRIWDVASSARVDQFIANSANVARRIKKYYRRDADVIHPPADTDFFTLPEAELSRSYFLIVSALVPYKKIGLAVEVFNRTGEPLKIVGTGPEFRKLAKRAKPNVEFLGQVPAGRLRELYRGALALLMPGEEDFGISAVEAQACGAPVIAYGRGGVLESVIPGETGIFFSEPSPAGLSRALDNFRGMKFNSSVLRSNAMRFSRSLFKERLAAYIEDRWRAFRAGP